MKYILTRAVTALELNAKVQELIAEGYRPFYSPQVACHAKTEKGNNTYYENDYLQAMIKDTSDEAKKLDVAIMAMELVYQLAEQLREGDMLRDDCATQIITILDDVLSKVKEHEE